MNSEKSDKIIKTHMVLSMGAGLVPLPFLDVVAVSAIQVDMLKQLSKQYDIDFSEQSGKSWITAIGGSVLARMGASGIKAIPVIGSILGGVTMSVLSGASTYAIGNVFKEHFKRGGDFTNIDLDDARSFFKEKIEEGKEIAKNMDDKKSKGNAKAEPSDDFIDRLKELADLKEKGLISEEEFNLLKKRLMD